MRPCTSRSKRRLQPAAWQAHGHHAAACGADADLAVKARAALFGAPAAADDAVGLDGYVLVLHAPAVAKVQRFVASEAVVGAHHLQRQAFDVKAQVFKGKAQGGGLLLAADGNADAGAGFFARRVAHDQGNVVRPLASACGWSRPSSPPAATGALPRLRRLHWFCPAALMSSSYSAKWLSVAWPRMAAGSVTSATTMSAESPGLLMRATGSSASNGSVTAYQSCAVTVAHINKHAAKRIGRRCITNTRPQDQIKDRLLDSAQGFPICIKTYMSQMDFQE